MNLAGLQMKFQDLDLQNLDPKYTKMCSNRTLQDDDKGFFLDLIKPLLEDEEIIGWLMETWVQKIYGTDYLYSLINHTEIYEKIIRTLKVAEIFRNKNKNNSFNNYKIGLNYLAKNELQKALDHINAAIIFAPCEINGEQLNCMGNLMHWTRSDILMKMEKFNLAIADIEYAEKNKFKLSEQWHLYYRKAICYYSNGDTINGKNTLNITLSFKQKDKAFKKFINEEMVKGQQLAQKFKQTKGKNEASDVTNNISIENSYLGEFYGIAKKDFKVGDTILTEKPYAVCLKFSNFGTHCFNCLKRLIVTFACQTCSHVAFCSEACMEQACKPGNYHTFECKFISLFMGSGMSVLCLLALRMVTKNSLQESLRLYNEYIKPREINDFDNRLTLSIGNDEKLVYNLCTHTGKRAYEDYFQRAMMAIFLCQCIRNSNYFNNNSSNMDTLNNEVSITALLLYNIQMLQFNAYEITDKMNNIGVGIYPNASLLNHECNISTGRIFVGNKLEIIALKSISAGEMIAENYGSVFTIMSKMERQRYLQSRYLFNCKCDACTFEWPKMDDLKKCGFEFLRCPYKLCNGNITNLDLTLYKCNKCHQNIEINYIEKTLEYIEENCIKKYNLAKENMRNKDFLSAIKLYIEGLNNFENVACYPHADTAAAQLSLRESYNLLNNYF